MKAWKKCQIFSVAVIMITALAITACIGDPPEEELTGIVTIEGIAEVGQTLTANTTNLNGDGTISYQWKRGNEDIYYETTIGRNETYVIQPDDVDSFITVTVTRSGYYGSVISEPTETVTDTRPEFTGTDLRLPYYYPGTGVTYNGFAGTEGTLTKPYGVTITYPSETIFNADGFFTLEGSIDNPSCYNYAYIIVTKDSDSDNLRTTYFVRNNFKQRIWLRFGSGAYTIRISGLGNVTVNLDGDGDLIGSFSYVGLLSSAIYSVTNTRNEGDMRFIYPSYTVQSDAPMVTGLAAALTPGPMDDAGKIKAIHDYIVKNTVYDLISSDVDGKRRKQDALTVLGTRYTGAPYDSRYKGGHYLAVCEGYANTFAALARAAGIETKFISSQSMGHGWNNVNVNGVWKFIDVTWDDPTNAGVSSTTNVVDMGPDFVRYNYYLLDSMNGVNNSHTDGAVENGRSLTNTSTLPWQRGLPDGWY